MRSVLAGESLGNLDGPVDVCGVNYEEKLAWILVYIGHVVAGALVSDGLEERPAAHAAVQHHREHALAGSRFVFCFPDDPQGSRVADERFGLHQVVAGPLPERLPDNDFFGDRRLGRVAGEEEQTEGQEQEDADDFRCSIW